MCQYDDGGKVCHKCQGYDNSELTTGGSYVPSETKRVNMEAVDLDFYYEAALKGIPERRITADVCKKYGVRTNDQGHHLFPGYNEAGDLVAVKTVMPAKGDMPKRFSIKGPYTDCVMFGAQAFPKTGRAVTITEGEYDAMAAYQATGSKYPNVSILAGALAGRRDFERNYEALDSFDSIVINFDSDKVGREGTEKVASMFPGKTKILCLVEAKDACDYLKLNKMSKYVDEFHRAQPYIISGIVNAADLWDEYCESKNVKSDPFPETWVEINQKTYGTRDGEIILITAGTGTGKTQVLRELKHHWLKNTKDNIFDISLEEAETDTIGGLVAIEANKRISLPDVQIDREEEHKMFNKLYDSRRMFLLKHEGSEGDDSLLDRMEYAATVLKCKKMLLDHITIAVSDGPVGQENMTMDKFMNRLLKLVKRHKITVVVVSHLRKTGTGGKSFEEGRIPCEDDLKGSGSLKQIAMTTIALSRNKYEENEKRRNTTRLHVLKCRFTGRSGPADYLHFEDDTGRMVAIDPETFFDGDNAFDGKSVGGSNVSQF